MFKIYDVMFNHQDQAVATNSLIESDNPSGFLSICLCLQVIAWCIYVHVAIQEYDLRELCI